MKQSDEIKFVNYRGVFLVNDCSVQADPDVIAVLNVALCYFCPMPKMPREKVHGWFFFFLFLSITDCRYEWLSTSLQMKCIHIDFFPLRDRRHYIEDVEMSLH